MSRVKLTIATTDYDHFRDFRLGITNAEGIDHTWLTLGHHEVFARFTFNREWDVSELSFALRPGDEADPRHHRAAGGLLTPVPILVLLREQAQQDQNGGRPQGQDDRLA